MTEYKGDSAAFDANWASRKETQYLHWTRGEPENQIQLAFRRHWITFNRLLDGDAGSKRCLEVGCGRGSLSAYFADAGWDCTLLDLSENAIRRAEEAFLKEDLKAKFDVGDCLDLPYEDRSFDLVFSIGLLEHFENIEDAITEQVRVLDKNGLFIGYVVPHIPDSLQKDFEWVNELLRSILKAETQEAKEGKVDVFRSDEMSPRYISCLEQCGLKDIGARGIYSLPMVSHSPEFPFSLLPGEAEQTLVGVFESWLEASGEEDPWLCDEGKGQAFIVWGRKAA